LGGRMPDERALDGVSLRPILDGQRFLRRQIIAFEYQEQVAVIDGEYKAVHDGRDPAYWRTALRKWGLLPQPTTPGAELHFELFHLATDPGESVDLASRQPERVIRMTALVQGWRRSVRLSRSGRDYGRAERAPRP